MPAEIAIELRRRLGDRIAKLMLVDWLVQAPPPFLRVLEANQSPDRWSIARDLGNDWRMASQAI